MARTSHKFDTLEYANQLRQAGFTEEQANVQAKTLLAVVEEHLLTKQDLKNLGDKVDHGFENIKRDIKDVKRDLKEVELRLFVKLISSITLIVSVISAVFKFLPMH